MVLANLICSILILSPPPINGNTYQGTLPDMPTVMKLVQTFIGPYFKSFNDSNVPNYRTGKETSVEKAIREKVAELKHLLQDNDEEPFKEDKESENLTLEGNDKTTIVEFVTNEKTRNRNYLRSNKNKATPFLLKNRMDKYKELRHNIKAALKKEHVSKSTINLVTNALDGMMTQLIESQCNWRSSNEKENNTEIANKPLASATAWNKQWIDLKRHYLKSDNYRNTSIPAELFLFYENFHEFLSHIIKDLNKFRGHSISCKFVKKNSTRDANKAEIRQRNITKNVKQYKCAHFKICSEELTKFMTSFYHVLNDTVISTLKNYASMYVKDTDDSEEKESVVAAVNNICDIAEHKTTKIFIKETVNLKLNDKKEKNPNIKALRNYIKETIEKTKTSIKNILESNLKSSTFKLMESVKTDLTVNADVDLNNLKSDFKSRICTVFAICNGQYAGRRGGEDLYYKNRNSVYVKVQLSLDDELKESLAQSRTAVLYKKPQNLGKDEKKSPHEKSQFIGTKMYRRGFEKGLDIFPKINITRTTLITSTTNKISTTIINKNDKTSTTAVATEKETSLN